MVDIGGLLSREGSLKRAWAGFGPRPSAPESSRNEPSHPPGAGSRRGSFGPDSEMTTRYPFSDASQRKTEDAGPGGGGSRRLAPSADRPLPVRGAIRYNQSRRHLRRSSKVASPPAGPPADTWNGRTPRGSAGDSEGWQSGRLHRS